MVKPRTRQKWKATLMLLLGLLWVLWSGFAFSSPYVARSLWEAFQAGWEVNVLLVLVNSAFWGSPLVLMCVWLGSPALSRAARCCWWTVTLLSQAGWIYLVL